MSVPGPLVVSLVPPTFAALDEAVARVVAGDLADVIEIRLDHIAGEVSEDPEPLAHLIECAELPFIAAIHGLEGFGSFGGSRVERFDALRAAASAGVHWLDVDESLAADFDCPGGARLILSSHGVEPNAPSLDTAARRMESMVNRLRGDLVKLVPPCDSTMEALRVMDWLAERPWGSTIAFGSGEIASFTRLLAPAFGSVSYTHLTLPTKA